MSENLSSTKPKLGWDIFRHDSDLRFSSNTNNGNSGAEVVQYEPEERQERIVSLFQTSTQNSPTIQEQQSPKRVRNGTPLHGNLTVVNQEVLDDQIELSRNLSTKLLRSIFTIDKVSCDVVLDNDCIKWTPVDSSQKRPGSGFGSRKPSVVDKSVLYLPELYAVKLNTLHNLKTANRSTLGFTLFYTRDGGENKLREDSIFFECFSREICVEWGRRVKIYIDAFNNRPRNVLVLKKESKNTDTVWQDTTKPLFINAGVTFDLVSMKQKGFFEDYIQHKMNEENKKYEAVIVIGKLKLFSEVLSGFTSLLTHSNDPSNRVLPTLGYIPTSHNCQVAGMLYGCSDPQTALLHVIYGNHEDVYPSLFDDGNPKQRVGLSASYGFYGADTVKRKSFKKSIAMTKALVQRRSYLCDVSYKTTDTIEGIQSDDFLFANEETEEHDWTQLPRRGYIDVTLSTLPGLMKPHKLSRQQVYVKLLSASISRRELTSRGSMGSIRSLREKMTTPSAPVANDYDVVDGDEVIVTPTNDNGYHGNKANVFGNLSSWIIDGCPLDPTVQRLHVKVSPFSLSMFCFSSSTKVYRPLTSSERAFMHNNLIKNESDV